jgi:formyltetrahydrofolate deformylase
MIPEINSAQAQQTDLVLTLSCPDRIGIVRDVSQVLSARGCNINESAQFTDRSNTFFMRIGFNHPSGGSTRELYEQLASIVGAQGGKCELSSALGKTRVLVMVSRFGHCLNDLLFRHAHGGLPIDIALIVSNHTDFQDLARFYGIDFLHLPVNPASKREQEGRLLDLVRAHNIDLVVLARYMQVLSDELCVALDGKAINIHHSFLPSFKGAKPYHQAYERGVKFIGATAHYVTRDLDEGPIIEQDVARAEHFQSPAELIDLGRDIECTVLARAVRLHAEKRVMLSGRRTVIFR